MDDSTQERGGLLRQIKLSNVLSFGLQSPPLALLSLNVLIGPNGAGKSNLIEALGLIRSTPGDMRAVVRRGGGAAEWVWKGLPESFAAIDLVVANPQGNHPLLHLLVFEADEQGFRLKLERIEKPGEEKQPYYNYRFQHGPPVVSTGTRGQQWLEPDTFNPDLSILAQLRDPKNYPEITFLAESYEKIRIYREWAFGRNTVFREPQKADMRNDRLEEDFSNLGLFLNRLRQTPKAKAAILDGLRDLYDGLTDFDVSIVGGSVQVFFTEGDFTIPATRLSDGSLRYLCLLAILCDPEPPPLICIEEPELGLHPDILPKLADHLVAASSRTQLVVTTHSDILVDAMTERPDAVVVCEKHEGKTEMRWLKRDELVEWLKKYRLGQLWTKGQLGGRRW